MMPRPVTTTRRLDKCRTARTRGAQRLAVGLDVVDGLLDGGDLLRFLVGDLGLELLLERHHQLDGVERVGAEVVDERRFVLDLGLVDAQLLGNDLLDPLFDVLHYVSFLVSHAADPGFKRAILPESASNAYSYTSIHVHAAVDVQACAGDVAGAGRREKGDRLRDVVGRAEPPERNLRRAALCAARPAARASCRCR